MSGLIPELERVRQYRRATRIAIEANATYQARCLALMDLTQAARAESDLLVRHWAQVTIWREAAGFLGMDDEEHEYPPEPYEAAQRRLRNKGYSACPRCLSELATDVDFDRWSRMRAAHVGELRWRGEAVEK